MAGTAAALVEWAHTQIGVTEHPPGSNHVRYWDDVGMPGAQGQPWCAAFYLAGLLAVGVEPVTRSVYVPTIRLHYLKAGLLFPVAEAQAGDQIIYTFGAGHTGVLVSVNKAMKTVTAIEGNTSSDVHGDQVNGGGVFLRTRPWGPIRGVGRPPFAPPSPPTSGVKPMFDPPVVLRPIVAEWFPPGGGHYQLGDDGSVYAWGSAPFKGAANGKPYFVGRKPARIEAPNGQEAAAGKVYVVVATSGERYAYPE